MNRKLLVISGILVALSCNRAGFAANEEQPDLYGFTMKTIDGTDQALSVYRGKALLIVNTASQCGYTPQYAGLEEVYQKYRVRGLEVLAFPSNDFLGQEPGTNEEIKNFCTAKYKTTFPLFAKIRVKGKGIDPLFAWLTSRPGLTGSVSWNFNKFLVDPDGKVVARFGSSVSPTSPDLVRKVEAALPNPR
jgi:glutathione peroxidase